MQELPNTFRYPLRTGAKEPLLRVKTKQTTQS